MPKNNEKLLPTPQESYSLNAKGIEAKITSWRSTPANILVEILFIINLMFIPASYFINILIIFIPFFFDCIIIGAIIHAFIRKPWKLFNEKTQLDYLLKTARMGEKNKPLLPTEEDKLYSPQIKTISAKANIRET